jgi:phospholipid/cholesterol/gamma-HCH transport system substrate-binding protein
MEPETRYTAIGATVLALIIAATLAFVWLASHGGGGGNFRFYTIYFERQSLEGLQTGADVNMRGVRVGRVENYTISRDNINVVRVRIRVAGETPVSENTNAVVARNLVTGIARINLETPGVPGPELVKVLPGQIDPVIAEGTSNLDQIADAAGRLAVSADVALANLNRLIGPDNQLAFAETLVAIRDVTTGLSQRMDALDRTTQGIELAAQAFQHSSRDIAQSVEQLATDVGPLARDAGATIREARTSLKAFTEVARNLERNLTQTVGRIERDTIGLAKRTDDAVDAGVHQLRATAEELRASVDVITRTMDRLQDPKALLLGPSTQQLGPGERAR